MMRTNIEWADLSANPLKYRDASGKVVWACVKKSAGCANCYSEAIAERFERGKPFTRANMADLTPFLDEKELKHILTAKQIGGKPVAGSKCFLGDMTDVFGEWVSDELLDRLFAVMALRKDVTFQILTKRPDRARVYTAQAYIPGSIQDACRAYFDRMDYGTDNPMPWPLPNVWLGVSVENQAAADERIPHLLATPAAVRFLSCEPLLGPVELSMWIYGVAPTPCGMSTLGVQCSYRGPSCPQCGAHSDRLHWVIVGGESGPGARPFELDWARSIQNQCDAADVRWFMKQAGSNPHDWDNGDAPNQEPPALVPLHLKDKKGGDLGELPSALRVREFPATTVST